MFSEPDLSAGQFFGPPPLIPGEDERLYAQFLARITTSVKPADFFEEMWVQDLVYLVWDALRLRRLKATYLRAVAHQGVSQVVEPHLSIIGALTFSEQWPAGIPRLSKSCRKSLRKWTSRWTRS